MSLSRHLRIPAFGMLAIAAAGMTVAGGAPAQGAPVPSPSAPGTVKPTPTAPTAAATYKNWVITVDASSTSARRLRHAKRTANAMSSLDPTVAQHVTSAARRRGAKVVRAQVNANNRVTLQLNRPVGSAIAASLASDPQIVRAEPDIPVKSATMTSTPNDTYFGLQWNLTGTYGVHADKVWPTDTGAGQKVAVIDTGITVHDDLSANILGGYDFITSSTAARDGNGRDSNPLDQGDWAAAGQCGTGSAAEASSWHGTHVAGIIAALGNNSKGITGVAPEAKVVPVRALGLCGGSSTDIADAITWASGGTVTGVPTNPNPAKVINLSLGGSYATCPSYYQTAINTARSHGANVVVAAGNEGVDAQNSVPANCNGVITVAATGPTGAIAYYSNYNGTTKHVTLAGPGGDDTQGSSGSGMIASTVNSSTTTPTGSPSYVYMEGTSQATPHVAGVVALMLTANPSLTPTQVTNILTSTATTTSNPKIGAGIVNAQKAVASARALLPASVAVTSSVTRGSVVGATASHYNSAESVSWSIDATVVARSQTTSSGSSSIRLTIPSNLALGTHKLTVRGLSSGRSASATFTVTS